MDQLLRGRLRRQRLVVGTGTWIIYRMISERIKTSCWFCSAGEQPSNKQRETIQIREEFFPWWCQISGTLVTWWIVAQGRDGSSVGLFRILLRGRNTLTGKVPRTIQKANRTWVLKQMWTSNDRKEEVRVGWLDVLWDFLCICFEYFVTEPRDHVCNFPTKQQR